MEKVSLKAKYIFEDNYEPEYVTGAFGGILPSGDLNMHFYLERIPIPYETEQGISDDGKLNGTFHITSPDPSSFKLRRTIKSGVIMSPSTTLNVYKWLKNKLQEMGVDPDEL